MSEVQGSAQSEHVHDATDLAGTVQTTHYMVVKRVSTKHERYECAETDLASTPTTYGK
jgi:hypothetical protein